MITAHRCNDRFMNNSQLNVIIEKVYEGQQLLLL